MEDTKTPAVESETGLPERGTWSIDAAHSGVGFVARHLMVSKVRGGFGVFSGTIAIGDSPETSSVEVVIDATSVDTGEDGRDQHLRSPDFLDVETYPHLTFRSTKVERTGESTLRVEGELTIRDATKPVTLDARFEGVAADPWGNTRIGFSARTQIDREDWGITWNQALETGGFLVSKKVDVELDVEAVLQAAKERAA